MTAPASTGSLASSPLLLFSAQLYATAELIQYPEPVKGKIALISFFGGRNYVLSSAQPVRQSFTRTKGVERRGGRFFCFFPLPHLTHPEEPNSQVIHCQDSLVGLTGI